MTKSTEPVRVIEETSAYWRVLFDYPPFNIVDATIFEGLQDLLARMGASLALLCLTGAVIWWPGIKHWRRSLAVDWSESFSS